VEQTVSTTPEGKVKAMVKERLDKEFPDHYRFMPVQSGFGATTLDFLICIDGLWVAIETKAPGGKLTPRQDTVIGAIINAGGLVQVVEDQSTLDHAIASIHIHRKFSYDASYRKAVSATQAQGAGQQHERPEQQGKTLAAPTGGAHGALGKAPY
jgi:hypothetical protein